MLLNFTQSGYELSKVFANMDEHWLAEVGLQLNCHWINYMLSLVNVQIDLDHEEVQIHHSFEHLLNWSYIIVNVLFNDGKLILPFSLCV